MELELRGQFISLITRFKKIDICASSSSQLQVSEMAIMIRALPEGNVNVSEIHQSLHISKAAVSQTLNTLEKKGYIIRKIDPADRRKIMVTVTLVGESELKKAKRLYDETMDRVLEQFGLENTKTFIKLMEDLIKIIEEMERN